MIAAPPDDFAGYVPVADAARALKVKRNTLWKYVTRNGLPTRKAGHTLFVLRSALVQYENNRRAI